MQFFQILHQTMCHPHVPIIYPRDLGKKSVKSFNTHIESTKAKICDPNNFKGNMQSSDADLA